MEKRYLDGHAHCAAGELDLAEAAWEEAWQESTLHDALFCIGRLRESRNDLDGAEQAYRESNSRVATYRLLGVLHRKGEIDEVETICQSAFKRSSWPRILYRLARMQFAAGKAGRAEKTLLSLDTDQASFLLAGLYCRLGRAEDSIVAWREAVNVDSRWESSAEKDEGFDLIRERHEYKNPYKVVVINVNPVAKELHLRTCQWTEKIAPENKVVLWADGVADRLFASQEKIPEVLTDWLKESGEHLGKPGGFDGCYYCLRGLHEG